MANRTDFSGILHSGASETVLSVLGEWLKTDDLNAKQRISGLEIVYEDKNIYMYCYEDSDKLRNQEKFILEGHAEFDPDQTRIILERLFRLCQAAEMRCVLEYVEVDEDGEEIGEELRIG